MTLEFTELTNKMFFFMLSIEGTYIYFLEQKT